MRRLRRLAAGFEAEPDAVILALLCLLGGISALLGPRPGSIAAALPGWLQFAWAVALLAGGAARTAGLLVRRVDVDAAGCALLGPAALIYGLIVVFRGPAGWVGGSLILAVGAGALIRCRRYWIIYRPQGRPQAGAP